MEKPREKTILVIDTGSSSMRGILYDLSGKELFKKQEPYSMQIGSDGSATMDAGIFSESLRDIVSCAVSWAEKNGCEFAAAALDSQRSSVLALSENMEPLAPILMWYDKRSSCLCDELLRTHGEQIYRLTGMRLTPVASAPKIKWLCENMPEIYDTAYKLAGIHDYLLFLMTGRLCTDASCACRSALMDIRTLKWSDELLTLFGIDEEKLPEILPPGSIAGTVCERFSAATGLPKVPVISAGGDQQCCVMGQGLMDKGIISVNSGSASYITALTDEPANDPSMEINATLSCGKNRYVAEASNMGTGTVIEWFLKTFYGPHEFDVLDCEIENEQVGSRGMICIPEFAGSGCPDYNERAQGMFAGINLSCTRATFARSLIEGICFDIDDAISHLLDGRTEGKRVCSTGGLSSFPSYNQILADITGLPVEVNSEPEATALGAFAVALTALGYSESPESFLRKRAGERKVFLPNAENREKYEAVRKRRELYRKTVLEAASLG